MKNFIAISILVILYAIVGMIIESLWYKYSVDYRIIRKNMAMLVIMFWPILIAVLILYVLLKPLRDGIDDLINKKEK